MNLLDPKVTSIRVVESDQELIPIPENSEKIHLDLNADLGYENDFIARSDVVTRLLNAGNQLPNHLILSIKETYRPRHFQEKIFYRRAKRLSELPENKDKSEQQLLELTAQFIAPPDVAGHPTGGAVDVSLIDNNGHELDLGCHYDQDEQSSNGRCFSNSENISESAKDNRRLLFRCMENSGFVNYPFEWWHWSYGDKYWAAVSNAPHAIYGPINHK